MKRIIQSIATLGVVSMLLVGCSTSGVKSQSIEIQNEQVKAQMREVTAQTIEQYFGINIDDGVQRNETAFENSVVDKKTGESTHVSNMFKGDTVTQVQEGDIKSYGVILDKDNQTVQGAMVEIFSSAKPQKYKTTALKAIADKFAVTSGIVDNPSEWIYEGLEKAISSKQLSVLRYKNENTSAYLLIGINSQTGEVSYFERAASKE